MGKKGKPPPVARALAPPLQTSFRPIRCRPPSSPSSRFPFAGMNQFALSSRRSEFGESRCTNENFGENNLGGIGAKLPRWPGNLFYPLGRPSVPSASGFRRFFCPDFRFLGCIGYPCPPCVDKGESRYSSENFGGSNFGDKGRSFSGGPGTCSAPPDVHPPHPSRASAPSFVRISVCWDESVRPALIARGVRGLAIQQRKLRREQLRGKEAKLAQWPGHLFRPPGRLAVQAVPPVTAPRAFSR